MLLGTAPYETDTRLAVQVFEDFAAGDGSCLVRGILARIDKNVIRLDAA